MDVMESLRKYSEENQSLIMTTLKVVQEKGWSQDNSDPFQFHIILGGKIRSQESRIDSLECDLEKAKEENLQCEKDLKDLKQELSYERKTNEDLDDELKSKFEEFKAIQNVVKNKHEMVDTLEDIVKEREGEIGCLKENCEGLARQVAECLILEEKFEIQNKTIEELRNDLKNKDHLKQVETNDDIKSLMTDIKHLHEDITEKEMLLETFYEERMEQDEKIHILEERNYELKTRLENLSIDLETSEEGFVDGVELKKRKLKQLLENKLHHIEKKVSDQKSLLVSNLFKLKDLEVNRKLTCNCKGRCQIYHRKHNWSSSLSEQIFVKLENVRATDEEENDATDEEKNDTTDEDENDATDEEKNDATDEEENDATNAIVEICANNPWGLNFLAQSRI